MNCCNVGRVKQWLHTKLVNESDKNCQCLEECVVCHVNFVYGLSTFQEFDETCFVYVEHEKTVYMYTAVFLVLFNFVT